MKSRWIIVLCVTLLWAASVASFAQDTPAPADEPEAAQEGQSADDEAEKKKIKNGLYVEVGYGTSDMDPLDTTLETGSTQSSANTYTLEGMDYSRAAIGWQLPDGKGRFRVVWEGYTENGHEFSAIGKESAIDTIGGGVPVVENLEWWQVYVVDGQLTTTRTPPSWTAANDTNMDGAVQQNEVTYSGADISFTGNMAKDMQNRVQTIDMLYGREWGPRRLEGRWWGGLRYFAYEGTLLQGAWLRSPLAQGLGFTDGLAIRLLHPSQKATGAGPTGSLGFQANFFDKRVQLFMNGQFAFLLSQIETDTGNFFTLTSDGLGTQGTDELVSGRARLKANRSRTSWHTHVNAGARFNMKQGLLLEVSYYKSGFLDAVLTPTEIRIPQSAQELAQGTSALFASQDLVMDGWRASVAFQF